MFENDGRREAKINESRSLNSYFSQEKDLAGGVVGRRCRGRTKDKCCSTHESLLHFRNTSLIGGLLQGKN